MSLRFICAGYLRCYAAKKLDHKICIHSNIHNYTERIELCLEK
jgi:hypothetical protein